MNAVMRLMLAKATGAETEIAEITNVIMSRKSISTYDIIQKKETNL